MNGEDPPERPDYITNIINGLERYNPEAVGTLETYLQEQCEQKYCDSNANRTLLKLYVSSLALYYTKLVALRLHLVYFHDEQTSTFPIT